MLTMDEIISMISFHFSIVIPLARHYTSWALGNLAKATKEPLQSQDELLSRKEEIRLVRGMYHFQLCCNLFGVSHGCKWDNIADLDNEKDLFKTFLHI